MRKATFVAKAVHGLVCAAIIEANLGSVELGQQSQPFGAFLTAPAFCGGAFLENVTKRSTHDVAKRK